MKLCLKTGLSAVVASVLLTACISAPKGALPLQKLKKVEAPAQTKSARLPAQIQKEKAAFNELDNAMGLSPSSMVVDKKPPIPIYSAKKGAYEQLSGDIKRIIGNGYGKTIDAARRDALNNLAGSIQVDVQKEVNACTNHYGDCGSVVKVNTRTEMPILGAQYQRLADEQDNVKFLVWIDSKTSLPMYVRDLKQLNLKIRRFQTQLQGITDKKIRYRVVTGLLDAVHEYDKKRLVVTILGGGKHVRAEIDVLQLKDELKQLEQRAPNLMFAAEVLVKGMNVDDIYIHAPRAKNSQEVTPFSSAIKEYISPFVEAVSILGAAKYTMEGEYDILETGDIYLSYRLIDLNYKIVNSKSVVIEKLAYKGFRAKPLAPAFETALHKDVDLSTDFLAELKTEQGTDALYYKMGDSVSLFARLNHSGYYYIIGHIAKKDEQLSYLLELADGRGDEQFIRYISPEEVNRYVEIATFEVIPPYGVEHLQLIAATQRFTQLPQYTYSQQAGGYYVLDGSQGNVIQSVGFVRGLRLKETSGGKLTSEATLTYTTER